MARNGRRTNGSSNTGREREEERTTATGEEVAREVSSGVRGGETERETERDTETESQRERCQLPCVAPCFRVCVMRLNAGRVEECLLLVSFIPFQPITKPKLTAMASIHFFGYTSTGVRALTSLVAPFILPSVPSIQQCRSLPLLTSLRSSSTVRQIPGP